MMLIRCQVMRETKTFMLFEMNCYQDGTLTARLPLLYQDQRRKELY
jgi:hypothetical protein